MIDRTNDKDQSPSSSVAKKPYQAPALIEWGGLRDITLSAGNSGNTDGSKSKTFNRTH